MFLSNEIVQIAYDKETITRDRFILTICIHYWENNSKISIIWNSGVIYKNIGLDKYNMDFVCVRPNCICTLNVIAPIKLFNNFILSFDNRCIFNSIEGYQSFEYSTWCFNIF